MRKCLWGVLLVAVVFLLPSSASAQASIAGSTRDTSGAALPGVTVEASSPALIEKVRTAVSDERGLFRIVNLPPGTYSVTFALPGFNQVKRDGIELTGSFTATVDADLTVGGVTETITVTGASPIVDVQSIRRQTTISNEVLTSIPTARSWAATALLIPGIVTIGGGPARHPGHAADDRVRRRRRAQQRRPHAGGRPERGRRARRQRRLDLRRRHLERAGSRDDDLRRAG